MFILTKETGNKNITSVHVSKYVKVVMCIVAAAYFVGFVSSNAYWNLIAGDAFAENIESHFRHAADALLSICLVIMSPLTDFPLFTESLKSLPDEPQLFTSALLCVSAMVVIGTIHVLIWGYRHRPLGRTYFRLTGLLLISAAFMAAVSFFFLLQFETEVLRMHSVLQPVRSDVLAEAMQNRSRDSAKTGNRIAVLERLLAKPEYISGHITQRTRQWFALDAREDPGPSRRRAFTLTVILLFAVTAACHIVYRTALYVQPDDNPIPALTGRLLLLSVCVSQLFMLSALCGTLGRSHVHPVVALNVDSPESGPTHPVFLLDEDDRHLIVYDRLQFFQIKRIPKSRILGVSQLFRATPFQNCARNLEEYVPCEAKGIRNGMVVGL